MYGSEADQQTLAFVYEQESIAQTRIVRFLAAAIRLSLAAVIVAIVPALASAQSIAGVVRDASGGVLPGVTVEASARR